MTATVVSEERHRVRQCLRIAAHSCLEVAGIRPTAVRKRLRHGAVLAVDYDRKERSCWTVRGSRNLNDKSILIIANPVKRDVLNRRWIGGGNRVRELAAGLRQGAIWGRVSCIVRHLFIGCKCSCFDQDRDRESVVTYAFRFRVWIGVSHIRIERARRPLIAVPARAIGQLQDRRIGPGRSLAQDVGDEES